jgi:outer membrane lipopolysaccharide assembly protein LptE/RlpB
MLQTEMRRYAARQILRRLQSLARTAEQVPPAPAVPAAETVPAAPAKAP